MSLVKISDDPRWKKISEKMARLDNSPVIVTMAKLEEDQAAIVARKLQIETQLSALVAKKSGSAWEAALHGDRDGLTAADQLRNEYRELEQRERFNAQAISEGRNSQDFAFGKECMEICHETQPDYNGAVLPKARAAARAVLELMETEKRLIEPLLNAGVRIDHLRRIIFPRIVSVESLEMFLRELDELD